MATLAFDALRGSIISFNPTLDVISFGAGYSASDVSYAAISNGFRLSVSDDYGSIESVDFTGLGAAFTALNATARVDRSGAQYLPANVEFADGSLLLIGDNSRGGRDGQVNALSGRAGNDHLAGLGGNDTLKGNGGDDVLNGGAGSDKIEGGAGHDVIYGTADGGTGMGRDKVYGGDGDDLVLYQDAAEAQLISGDAGDDTLIGGNGADSIYGGADDDVILGFGGANRLEGGTGDDVVLGGDGNETVRGGTGSDTIAASGGNNLIYGDEGDDLIAGNEFSGRDTVYGGAGNDLISYSGGAAAELIGSTAPAQAAQLIYGETGNDTLRGGTGDDFIYGGLDDDYVVGNAGDDRLFGDGGDDWLRGNSGNDTITGGLGRDLLVGSSGDDTFVFRAGDAAGKVDRADVILDFRTNRDDLVENDRIDLPTMGTVRNYTEHLGTSVSEAVLFGNADIRAGRTYSYVEIAGGAYSMAPDVPPNSPIQTGYLFADLNHDRRVDTVLMIQGSGSVLDQFDYGLIV